MTITETDLEHIALLIQRMLDAEILLDSEGVALLAETELGLLSLAQGDSDGARLHVEKIAHLTEALVRTDALDGANGQSVIEAARRIVTEGADRTTPIDKPGLAPGGC